MKKRIWKCHYPQNKGKKDGHASLSALAAATRFNLTLYLRLKSRGEGHLAGRTLGSQSTLAQEGVRSMVTSKDEAECKLQKFIQLFLLSEQIPDKLSVNKAGKFSALPAVGKVLACS